MCGKKMNILLGEFPLVGCLFGLQALIFGDGKESLRCRKKQCGGCRDIRSEMQA